MTRDLDPEKIIVMDSDGCVLDAMESKHRKAFIPAIFDVWPLADIYDSVIQSWLRINLYSDTRGVNRYLALSIFLHDLQEVSFGKYNDAIPDPNHLDAWIQSTASLSEKGLLAGIQSYRGNAKADLEKILQWTRLVNRNISWLPEPEVFYGALPALKKALSEAIPVYVVSSANRAAIESEWRNAGIDAFTKGIFGQEDGTKAEVLKQLATAVSHPQNVLMIGDSPGDMTAAHEAGVLFYPIMPQDEIQSWLKFSEEILPVFQGNQATTGVLQDHVAAFEHRLGIGKWNLT